MCVCVCVCVCVCACVCVCVCVRACVHSLELPLILFSLSLRGNTLKQLEKEVL